MYSQIRISVLLLIAGCLLITPCVYGAEQNVESTSESGSGKKYETFVDRKTEGELTDEDLRQASLLSSQIMTHIIEASRYLEDEKPDAAQANIGKAQTLVRIIRDLLPVTTVTTTVKNPKGEEVYRNVEKVQDDLIPIFEKMVAIEVIQPILEEKEDQAAVKGLQLADADLMYTTVLVDLDYVERKLNKAVKVLNDIDKARSVLSECFANGVRLRVDKEDHPLASAQLALQLAERQVKEGKYAGAKRNLVQANVYLEMYRSLVGESEKEKVRDLEEDIKELSEEVEKAGASEEIRGFWHRVTRWFHREPGETQETTENEDAENK